MLLFPSAMGWICPGRTGATKGLGAPASIHCCQVASDPLAVKCAAVRTLQLFTNCPSQQKGWWCAATSLFLQNVCAWFADWLSCKMPVIFAILSAIKIQTYPVAISVPRHNTTNHRAQPHFERVRCVSVKTRVRFSSYFKQPSVLWPP